MNEDAGGEGGRPLAGPTPLHSTGWSHPTPLHSTPLHCAAPARVCSLTRQQLVEEELDARVGDVHEHEGRFHLPQATGRGGVGARDRPGVHVRLACIHPTTHPTTQPPSQTSQRYDASVKGAHG